MNYSPTHSARAKRLIECLFFALAFAYFVLAFVDALTEPDPFYGDASAPASQSACPHLPAEHHDVCLDWLAQGNKVAGGAQ